MHRHRHLHQLRETVFSVGRVVGSVCTATLPVLRSRIFERADDKRIPCKVVHRLAKPLWLEDANRPTKLFSTQVPEIIR